MKSEGHHSPKDSAKPRVRVIGYCELEEQDIVRRMAEDPVRLTEADGEFALVLEDATGCTIVTSAYGVCQYYYAVHRGRFHHGETLLSVLRDSGLDWRWNWSALGDLVCLDYLLGNVSLHPEVARVPPRSVVRFENGRVSVVTRPWDELHTVAGSDPRTAVASFHRAVRKWLTPDTMISLSGGMDSRVILASLLQDGHKPPVVTMGSPGSTDVRIATAICERFDLEQTLVELALDDYLTHGSRISALTDGAKTACHWHTFLYPHRAIGDPTRSFLVGTNGAWAKTPYFDKGILAIAQSCFAKDAGLRRVARERIQSVFTPEELGTLEPSLAGELNHEGNVRRAERIIALCHDDLLLGTNRFYLDHRVKNFNGHGMKLYAESAAWRAPFLSREWVTDTMNLRSYWRLGLNWHRFALRELHSDLLEFPEPGRGERTARHASWRYWLRQEQRTSTIPYASYAEWFTSDKINALVMDHRALLAEWIPPDTVARIMQAHRQSRDRVQAVGMLVTMVFWQAHVRGLPGAPASSQAQ